MSFSGDRKNQRLSSDLPIFTLLAIVLFLTRLNNLTVMPLFNDEAVFLTRAVQVWHGHPFWYIGDGRIINQWAIAAFYPQHDPVFIGRITTIFVILTGFAAGYALSRRWFGRTAGILTGLIWITCPYLFFYERTAMIDGEAGALAVIAVLAALHLVQTGSRRDAILTGLALAVAMLFKFTAIPFVFTIGLIVLFIGKMPLRRRLTNLIIIGVVVAACFTIPVIYASFHGGFAAVFEWLAGSGGNGFTWDWNVQTLWAQLIGYGSVFWPIFLGLGLLAILFVPASIQRQDNGLWGPADIRKLLGASTVPMILILIIVTTVMPRHLVVALPILLVLAGAGLGLVIDRLSARLSEQPQTRRLIRLTTASAIGVLLIIGVIPFASTAYSNPAGLTLPFLERGQFVTGYSAGFGLRAAVLDLPNTVGTPGKPIIASMYGDLCRLANFYDTRGYNMQCTDNTGITEVKGKFVAAAPGASLYVLTEAQPIGLNPTLLKALPNATLTRIEGYPQPGETQTSASIVLWRLDKTAG